MKEIINAANIDGENFYNLCRIADCTRYADPIRAMAELAREGSPLEILVTRDDCGNIIAIQREDGNLFIREE
mgnify:CR=1 FL=1|tara:strand:+ start:233 stop:448 length:216 start_codon:yes stop_codon:yes gene_type:complete